MKKVLIIAGSDSGGGAGIQADLKTLMARGVYGMSAITALTAQNTLSVQGVIEVEPTFIKQQIDSAIRDIGANIWKTGMLSSENIIKIVATLVRSYNIRYLVMDPVMVAKSGAPLLKEEAVEYLIKELIPLAYVITPNKFEAEKLSGMKINDFSDFYSVAEVLFHLGPKNVVIKGGFIKSSNESVDLLYDGNSFTEFHSPWVDTQNTHGTGCTFASAIAAELAKGQRIKEAVHIAKAYLYESLVVAKKLKIGHGNGPLDHSLGKVMEINTNLIKIIE